MEKVLPKIKGAFPQHDTLELGALRDIDQLRFITRLEYVSKFIIVKKNLTQIFTLATPITIKSSHKTGRLF